MYSLSPSYSFLSVVGDNMILQTNDFLDEGVYELHMEVYLQDWPLKSRVVKTIQLQVICEILQMEVFQALPY